MGLFSFGNKNDTPSRRGANARSSRSEPRRRRTERSGDPSAKDAAYPADAMLLDPTLPEKQRARRRLVGAIALVIAAVVLLPMVLDSHPKPVTDDIAIDIPNWAASVPARAGGEPANMAEVTEATDPATEPQAGVAPDSAGVAVAGVAQLASSAADTNAPNQSTTRTQPANPARSVSSGKPAGSPQQPAAPTVLLTPPSPATKPQAQRKQAAKSATMPVPSAANADSGTPATPAGARFAVQLGMFVDEASARQWERKLTAAGVPAYIERRKQADGSMRALLRAGPFPDRAAASAAIAKVREAGLTANAAQ